MTAHPSRDSCALPRVLVSGCLGPCLLSFNPRRFGLERGGLHTKASPGAANLGARVPAAGSNRAFAGVRPPPPVRGELPRFWAFRLPLSAILACCSRNSAKWELAGGQKPPPGALVFWSWQVALRVGNRGQRGNSWLTPSASCGGFNWVFELLAVAAMMYVRNAPTAFQTPVRAGVVCSSICLIVRTLVARFSGRTVFLRTRRSNVTLPLRNEQRGVCGSHFDLLHLQPRFAAVN